jgi:virginiamycin B lyase
MCPSAGQIDVFRDPTGMMDAPTGIIGAGGDVWFTSIANARIGRVRMESGSVETFADPADRVRLPANIFPGIDGRVWFTSLGSDRLGSVDPRAPDPALTIVTYAHPDLSKPVALKSSPGGRLWFSLRGSDGIGSIDPAAPDPISSVRVLHSDRVAGPAALFIDPGGRVWWVNADNGTIGFFDPEVERPADSIIALGPWPTFGSPRAWAIDPAGWLWVTTQDRPGLLTFDPTVPDPTTTVRWVTDERLETPDGVWCGVDGALWFADTSSNAIGRHDPRVAGPTSWQFFGGSPDVDGPFDIKPGGDPTDGCLWFTNKSGNTIGRIQVTNTGSA